MNEVEHSVIDEEELQRQLEEELANMQYQPDADDLLERQSNYSIFNQSQSNFNMNGGTGPNGLESSMNNMDAYKEVADVIPENWNDELEDLKRLNLQELDGLIEHRGNNNTINNMMASTSTNRFINVESTPRQQKNLLQEGINQNDQSRIKDDFKVKVNNQGKFTQSPAKKKYDIPQIVLAEEKLLESYNNQMNNQLQLENSILQSQELIGASINFDQYKTTQDDHQLLLNRHEDMLDRIKVVNQGIKQMQEYELEMERLFMEREDKLSREIEEYNHRSKFIQKDMHPPLLPPYFQQADNPLKSKPVQRTPIPTAPMTDNFVKYRINLSNILPVSIDLSKVKILWSLEKQVEAEEKQRIEFEKQRREQEHKRLCDLLTFSLKAGQEHPNNTDQIKQQTKTHSDSLGKFLTQSKQNIKQASNYQPNIIQIDIKPTLIGKDPKIYDSPDEIYQKHLLKQHQDLSSNLLKIIPSLKQAQPTLKDIEDPKPKVVKNPRQTKSRKQLHSNDENDDFMNIPDMQNSDSLISQALELHAPIPNKAEKVEIKNEQLTQLDLKPLNSYKNLQLLNLSMNKIQTIENGVLDLPYLNQLRLSDNVIKEIPSGMFSKCQNLRILYLDINQLKKIPNLQNLANLEELSMANNQISSLDGIQNLTKLRRLNLSFNKITQLDTHLNNLGFLENLELGKNFISNIDNFPQHKLLYLSELYIYSNQLVQIPKDFAMPQLKILNLNRNQDLHQLSLGYNPMLEQLNASYCSLVQIRQLGGCPNLREVDISFNSINSLDGFMGVIERNKQMRSLRFSDNPFSVNKDLLFNNYLKRIYPYLERVNGEAIPSQQQLNYQQQLQYSQSMRNLLSIVNQQAILRQFVTKLMSQKIRITFFSTTHLMRYCKAMMPFITLQQLTQQLQFSHQKSNTIDILCENHLYVQQLKSSVRIISSFMRKRKLKRKALLNKMSKHVPKLVKIQALIRGHLTRVKNQALVDRIKRDGPKKTKKYQQISKLQANIKGFLFRKRRVRALQKLGKKEQHDFEDDFEEFDADKFFGIKEEAIMSNGLSLPQEQMMQQMIQMMAMQNQQIKRPTMGGGSQMQTVQDNNGVKFPPINQKNQTQTNINELIKPRSMIQNQQKSNGVRPNRPPSARSNAISEIDMNSDSQSMHHHHGSKGNSQIRKNNLMNQTNDFSNPHHMPSISANQSRYNGDDQSDRQSVYSMNSNPFYPTHLQNQYKQKQVEERKNQIIKTQEVIDEWGFQNEETKKMFEARMKKKNQGKKKQLTADEKLQKFKAMNEGTRKK